MTTYRFILLLPYCTSMLNILTMLSLEALANWNFLSSESLQPAKPAIGLNASLLTAPLCAILETRDVRVLLSTELNMSISENTYLLFNLRLRVHSAKVVDNFKEYMCM